MKNCLLLFLLVLVLYGCNNESPKGSATVADTPAAQASPTATNSANTPPAQAPKKLDATLTLAANSTSIGKGQEGCIAVTCVGFVDLVSMQYTMIWDSEVLQFKEVRGFNLPYLGTSNFGAHRSDQGELTFVWIDNSLKGVTKDDGTAVFEVCFTAKGDTGQATAFQFTDKPTLIEAVHKSVQEVNFKGLQGVIKVQ